MHQTHAQTHSALDAVPDEVLVARLCAGERALFETLMRRHNRRLFRAARSIVKSDDEAEDVMQEAYVQAFTHLAQFEGRAKFATWLTRIAVHAALARVRRQREVLVDTEEDADVDGESPEETVARRELSALLTPMVDALPLSFRSVFVLRAVEGLSVAETAQCLELREETVRTRFFRARQQLQLSVEEQLRSAEPELFEFRLERCDRVVAKVLRALGVGSPS
ncbi:MAG TPA: RNA polymerase sigma factor [Polyangiales bacterium]